MSAVAIERRTCPDWCLSHTEADFHDPRKDGTEACLSADVELEGVYGSLDVGLGLGTNPGDQVMFNIGGCDFTADGAREVIRTIKHAINRAKPASPDYLNALSVPLTAINDARGTSHTIESVAADCGIVLEGANMEDAERLAAYIGGELMTS